MVKQNEKKLDEIFHALSDTTRRKILLKLVEREHTVSELAQPFEISLAAVSKHLKVLERAGLLVRARMGREHHLQAKMTALNDAMDVIAHYQSFWNKQLDALEVFLNKARAESKTKEE